MKSSLGVSDWKVSWGTDSGHAARGVGADSLRRPNCRVPEARALYLIKREGHRRSVGGGDPRGQSTGATGRCQPHPSRAADRHHSQAHGGYISPVLREGRAWEIHPRHERAASSDLLLGTRVGQAPQARGEALLSIQLLLPDGVQAPPHDFPGRRIYLSAMLVCSSRNAAQVSRAWYCARIVSQFARLRALCNGLAHDLLREVSIAPHAPSHTHSSANSI